MQEKKRKRLFVLFIIAAACFILLGGFRNELSTVYRKASNICMECIGIG